MTTYAGTERGVLAREKGRQSGRHQYWPLPALQWRFIAWLVATSTVMATTAAWAVLLVVWSPLSRRFVWAGGGPPQDLFGQLCGRVLLTTAVLVAVFGLISLLSGLVLSHRVAGPLYRLGRVAERVAKGGRGERVELRRADYIHDFAEQFNAMLDSLEGRLVAQRRTLTILEDLLNDLERIARSGQLTRNRLRARLQEALELIRSNRITHLAEETPFT